MSALLLNNESLILNLIKQDLKSNKLILNLINIGWKDAGEYHLHLDEIIFKLMEFDDPPPNELQDLYAELMDKSLEIRDVENEAEIQVMAAQVYEALLAEKRKLDEQVKPGKHG